MREHAGDMQIEVGILLNVGFDAVGKRGGGGTLVGWFATENYKRMSSGLVYSKATIAVKGDQLPH